MDERRHNMDGALFVDEERSERPSDRDRESRRPSYDDGKADAARRVTQGILDRMDLEANVQVRENDERIVLDIEGPDAGRAIGKKGMTLEALQFLVNKIVNRDPDERRHIVLDSGDYRERHDQGLVSMAKREAKRAVTSGRAVTLEPMSARDRRVIHVSLAKFPGVSTRSEGEGMDRRLQIIPARGGDRARDARPRERNGRDERPAGREPGRERPRDERTSARGRDERPPLRDAGDERGAVRDERTRDERGLRDDRPTRDDRLRDDRPIRDDRLRDDRVGRDDRSRDERGAAREERPRDERSAVRDVRGASRDERSRDDRPTVRDDRGTVRDDRSPVRDERSGRGDERPTRAAAGDERVPFRDDRARETRTRERAPLESERGEAALRREREAPGRDGDERSRDAAGRDYDDVRDYDRDR